MCVAHSPVEFCTYRMEKNKCWGFKRVLFITCFACRKKQTMLLPLLISKVHALYTFSQDSMVQQNNTLDIRLCCRAVHRKLRHLSSELNIQSQYYVTCFTRNCISKFTGSVQLIAPDNGQKWYEFSEVICAGLEITTIF